MHWTRIWTLFGVVLGVAALFTKGATTDAEELLPALSEASADFPDGISTIWGGLDTWVQVVVVIAIIAVVAFAFMPPFTSVEAMPFALGTTIIGAALLVYAIVKFLEASDDAETLQNGLARAAEGGMIPAAFTVSVGAGFYVLMAGTAMVAIGGLVMLITKSDADEAAA
ncbi:MAG: hypothetical protein WCC01_12515 [Acidimicrobiia bacterium]